jgi:hypothetical protein
MSEEQPLQVARCTKIIADENEEKSKYASASLPPISKKA